MTAAREALLDRCIEVLHAQGFGDLSLREIAAAAGTSHRMLNYHFGSRDGLLAAVVGRIEATQRAALAALTAGEGDELRAGATAYWRQLKEPGLAPAERLFFEIYAHALHGREWTESFRAAVIGAWEAPLVELLGRVVGPGDARAAARLSLAVTRGLLLDLLLTKEDEVLDEAMELFGRLLLGRPA
ncbi:TetR/AcrR family transcriptional regulator [Hamadaea tsunoensis]|uniref:TetR/AcrR family transcriptional regulator n=1 Tax=Hamadaea tsunoensis TaxID=53368 RepID=UPI0003F7151E|nr:TetR/AcrR family transcriptional regulator [Hamadaea tsunoensis]